MLGRPVEPPHFLEIIELTDFRPENMDDDIAGIDQHPIAALQAFDFRCNTTKILKDLEQMIGDGSDMRIGTAGGDDHGIGDRGFSMQIDGDNILGFGILEARQNRPHDGTDIGFSRTMYRLGRELHRPRKNRRVQRFDPFAAPVDGTGTSLKMT